MSSISPELSDLFFNYQHDTEDEGWLEVAAEWFKDNFQSIIPELQIVSAQDLIDDFLSRV